MKGVEEAIEGGNRMFRDTGRHRYWKGHVAARDPKLGGKALHGFDLGAGRGQIRKGSRRDGLEAGCRAC